MPDWSLLLQSALVCGLILSLALTTLMLITAVLAPDMWVSDYPPEIRHKFGPMSPRAARLRPFAATFVFLVALLIPLLGLSALGAKVGHIPFMPALAFFAASLLVFNIFDLIVLDWLLFCTLRPRWVVLPGTEGMAGYRDYAFHFVGFLKGLAFCAAGGLVIAAVWTLAQALT